MSKQQLPRLRTGSMTRAVSLSVEPRARSPRRSVRSPDDLQERAPEVAVPQNRSKSPNEKESGSRSSRRREYYTSEECDRFEIDSDSPFEPEVRTKEPAVHTKDRSLRPPPAVPPAVQARPSKPPNRTASDRVPPPIERQLAEEATDTFEEQKTGDGNDSFYDKFSRVFRNASDLQNRTQKRQQMLCPTPTHGFAVSMSNVSVLGKSQAPTSQQQHASFFRKQNFTINVEKCINTINSITNVAKANSIAITQHGGSHSGATTPDKASQPFRAVSTEHLQRPTDVPENRLRFLAPSAPHSRLSPSSPDKQPPGIPSPTGSTGKTPSPNGENRVVGAATGAAAAAQKQKGAPMSSQSCRIDLQSANELRAKFQQQALNRAQAAGGSLAGGAAGASRGPRICSMLLPIGSEGASDNCSPNSPSMLCPPLAQSQLLKGVGSVSGSTGTSAAGSTQNLTARGGPSTVAPIGNTLHRQCRSVAPSQLDLREPQPARPPKSDLKFHYVDLYLVSSIPLNTNYSELCLLMTNYRIYTRINISDVNRS